jgi:hypothetical protein
LCRYTTEHSIYRAMAKGGQGEWPNVVGLYTFVLNSFDP